MQTRNMQDTQWMRFDTTVNFLPTAWTEIPVSGIYVFNGPYGTNIKISDTELASNFNVNPYNAQIQFLYDTFGETYIAKGQFIKSSTSAGTYVRKICV